MIEDLDNSNSVQNLQTKILQEFGIEGSVHLQFGGTTLDQAKSLRRRVVIFKKCVCIDICVLTFFMCKQNFSLFHD